MMGIFWGFIFWASYFQIGHKMLVVPLLDWVFTALNTVFGILYIIYLTKRRKDFVADYLAYSLPLMVWIWCYFEMVEQLLYHR